MIPKILVVGDEMSDVYYFGTTTRISPEAPIPVVKVTDSESFHGGAGNTFVNLVALGVDVKLRAGTPTPIKSRLMIGNTQIARWDMCDEVRPIPLEELDQAILHWEPDAIVVSDYGKGSVSKEVIEWVNAFTKPIFVDTKGDPKRFRSDCTFFPNILEYKLYNDIYSNLPFLILKRGAEGIQRLFFGEVRENFTAKADKVVSVCGAGDTVIAAYAYASCVGYPDPLQFANTAAAVVVEKPWTATASLQEVEERLGCQIKLK